MVEGRPEAAEGRRPRPWVIGLALVVAGSVFWLHGRFVLAYFTDGARLLDAGWFAYLFGSGDPWLHGPRSVTALSYYNVHVSPYLSAASVLFAGLHVDGITALALHQGIMFAVLATGLLLLGLYPASAWPGAGILLAAVVTATIGDMVHLIASFPHFEIAILSLCTLGAALLQRGQRGWAALAFAIAALVREDGGLYAAVFLVGDAVARSLGSIAWRGVIVAAESRAAALALLGSASMFWIKDRFFPAFSTFGSNFSGQNWDHLTPAFVLHRLAEALFLNPRLGITILVGALLSRFSPRYLLYFLGFSPILAAYLLAVRDMLGHFTDYYVIPWLAIWVGMFIVAGYRGRAGLLRPAETAILLVGSLCCSTPVFALIYPPSLPASVRLLAAPVAGLPQLKRQLTAAMSATPHPCASGAVAALAPDAIDPPQVAAVDQNKLAGCSAVFVLRTDGGYGELRSLATAAGLTSQTVIGAIVERLALP